MNQPGNWLGILPFLTANIYLGVLLPNPVGCGVLSIPQTNSYGTWLQIFAYKPSSGLVKAPVQSMDKLMKIGENVSKNPAELFYIQFDFYI